MTSNIIEQLNQEAITASGKVIPKFRVGDTVSVSVNVSEEGRERLQSFKGVVIARRNRGFHSSFTVRKLSGVEGVERVFHLYSPIVANIKVERMGDVRKAKLYHLRGLTGKKARIKEKLKRKD